MICTGRVNAYRKAQLQPSFYEIGLRRLENHVDRCLLDYSDGSDILDKFIILLILKKVSCNSGIEKDRIISII